MYFSREAMYCFTETVLQDRYNEITNLHSYHNILHYAEGSPKIQVPRLYKLKECSSFPYVTLDAEGYDYSLLMIQRGEKIKFPHLVECFISQALKFGSQL